MELLILVSCHGVPNLLQLNMKLKDIGKDCAQISIKTEPGAYPLPKIDDIVIKKVVKYKYLSTFDLKSAY